ncbi:Uncharacterised protein [Segatella copri]|nr:Uncharacterised protein [Segatella copri]
MELGHGATMSFHLPIYAFLQKNELLVTSKRIHSMIYSSLTLQTHVLLHSTIVEAYVYCKTMEMFHCSSSYIL